MTGIESRIKRLESRSGKPRFRLVYVPPGTNEEDYAKVAKEQSGDCSDQVIYVTELDYRL